MRIRLLPLAALLAGGALHAAELARITVTHDLNLARPSETIAIPWSEINRALPGALIQKITVKDSRGNVLPYQVSNVKPQAKDPQGVGIAYGELYFQHSFAAGEQQASFTVEKTDVVTPPFPAKTFGRYIPERLDDFAWENDHVAHRTYGPALGAPDTAGVGKEVLVTSGLDIWFKRVAYPVVDRWYNKGHDHYHHDEGEGMDLYNVGKSRGAGGTGVWDGKQLYVGRNYASWKVLANGPIRTVFELNYDSWDAAGAKVSEVKRFTVDAGQDFDTMDSTFTFSGPAQLTVAVGLNKKPSDKKQDEKVTVGRDGVALTQWVTQASNGAFGTAVVLPTASGTAEDALNELIVAPVESGKPLRYYLGAAWDRAGHVKTQAEWQEKVKLVAARAAHPLKATVSTD